MLSLKEVVAISPVHILYLGSETEVLEEIEPLLPMIENQDLLEFTCVNDASDLLTRLYLWPNEQKKIPIVVFGLLRYMSQTTNASNESLARLWIAIFNSGLYVLFGDTSTSPVADSLLSLAGAKKDIEK